MTTDTTLLISRDTRTADDVLASHAARLRRRDVTDTVRTATYGAEPVRDLRGQLEAISADTVYVVPLRVAHDHETLGDVPAALSYLSGTVHYCEPLGRSPAITAAIADVGAGALPPAEDVSLILVAFGSSSTPFQRQMAEYHAARLRAQSDYGEVLPCFLLQNPAVECVRYATSTPRAVAVPLFLTRTEATESQIPADLELDRGGIEYADPLGDHPRVTDAIAAAVAKQRALAAGDGTATQSLEAQVTDARRPMAADGEGPPR